LCLADVKHHPHPSSPLYAQQGIEAEGNKENYLMPAGMHEKMHPFDGEKVHRTFSLFRLTPIKRRTEREYEY